MKAAIHQPHYFPWLGYFDKMAKADVFVLLDEVQLEARSNMLRNRVLNPNGVLTYITIESDKTNHHFKKYNEIPSINNDRWKQKQRDLLSNYYRKAPYFAQTMELIDSLFQNDYKFLSEWCIASVMMIKDLLNIETRIVMQSDLDYDRNYKKSELMMGICLALGADTYFSGRGASVDYLDRVRFDENHVNIEFQDFQPVEYPQCNSAQFVPGISILDMLFNCGVEETRTLFWNNMHR